MTPGETRPARAGEGLKLLLTLVALLVLAGTSLALSFADLGAASFPVALGIAAVKAVLVVVIFMEIADERPSIRFALVTGVVLLGVMMVLVVADIVTRTVPPLADPPGTAPRAFG